ncbi:MAG: 2,3-cyclic 3-phosphodiesterase [Eubacteriales bacterium]|nr:2,3-cyclic 3-phosphodiesterase [Eubacteriales bacterium]
MKKRVFIAIDIPEEIRDWLEEWQEELRRAGITAKWVERENFHITLKFLGEVEVGKLENIRERLRRVARQHHPFSLRLKDVGVFPPGGVPQIVWMGVTGDMPSLLMLHRQVEDQMFECGFPHDRRKFHAHLTLGRLKNHPAPQEEEFWAQFRGISAPLDVEEFLLMESVLTPQGPIYHVIERFSLGKQGKAGLANSGV